MKALVLKAFGELAVEDRPDPVPAPDDVILRVIATGICGSDLHGFTGTNGRRSPGQIMGHESVARVHALGSDVDPGQYALGQPATFNPLVIPTSDLAAYRGREQHCPDRYVIGVRPDVVGSFAQFVAVPARNVVVLPDSMPIQLGALVEPLAVAVHAVRRIRGDHIDTALVVGGGPIGQSAVVALSMAGVGTVIVSEPDAGRRDLITRLGAVGIDPGDGSVAEQVRAIAGRPADAAIDAAGVTGSVRDALAATVRGGPVCLLGMGSPRLDVDAYAVSTEERSLVGSFAYSSDDFASAAAHMATAPPTLDALISREVPLAEAHDAFTALARPDGTPGKVLVRLDL